MSTSKAAKYVNNLTSDAFLKAPTINTRLSLLGRELNDNIDNLVINEKTLGQVFKKDNKKNKTIYTSNKFKINYDDLISDILQSDNILIEEKNRTILFKGEDDDEQLRMIEEEKEQLKEIKPKKENVNLFEGIMNVLEDGNNKKEDNQQKGQMGTIFEQILEEKEEDINNDNIDNIENLNVNNNNNKENTGEKKEIKFMRASTIFQDVYDFNQEFQEIKENAINDLNEKKPKNNNNNQNNNQNDNLHMSAIFNNILSPEEKKNQLEENKIQSNSNKIEEKIIEKEEEEEDKKKDVLKEEYYPIDVIEEAEKYYNLSNDSKEDLYPLNTYQMNHGLAIDFINSTENKINTKNASILTSIGIDDKKNIYICTEDGKIIKKDKRTNKEILINSKKYGETITCIDIVDKYIVTGDETGNIIIWKDDKINQALINLNNKNAIICIKIVELIQNDRLIIIFTDIIGGVYLVNVNINKIGDFVKSNLLNSQDMPIYNIIMFPNKIPEIMKEKQSVILILATSLMIGIYSLDLVTKEFTSLKKFDYLYGEKGKFQFDFAEGLGFPPVADLKNKMGRESAAAARGSISNSIAISDQDQEYSMIVVSYGNVIQLFGFRLTEKNVPIFKIIGHYINEKPVLRLFFIFNSMIALMTDNLTIKLINTYDFVPKVYNAQVDKQPTKNCLISYNVFDLYNCGIQGQEIVIVFDNKMLKKNIFTNKIIPIENGIIIIGKDTDKYYQLNLLNYDKVINNLSDNGDYIRMLWLSLIIFNKNKNLLNKQLNFLEKDYNKNKKDLFNNQCLMPFFVSKVIAELANNNEIYVRMFLEFLMETNYFDLLPTYLDIVAGKLDNYIYINLTKYIVNGNLYDIVLNSDLLEKYINYYIKQNEKLLLNKVLLKLNLDTLLQTKILQIILENYLINPYIYTQIKNIKEGKIDYFQPVFYLDSVFKKDIIREKNELEMQNDDSIKQLLSPEKLKEYEEEIRKKKEIYEKELEENKKIGQDYKKLIIEHNMDYFNEKTFSCHEYIGHKFLWYCNKCLLGKEYPNDTQMSPNNYKETSIKILDYLIMKENVKLYLEFDSYTYLQIIKKYFLEEKLFNIISNKNDIDKYLGNKRSETFTSDYIFKTLNDGVKDAILNNFYIHYDFYLMISEIFSQNKDISFDKAVLMDVLKFFSGLNVEDLPKDELYNCHRKLETRREIRNYNKKMEEYMMNILVYLKDRSLLEEKFVKGLLNKSRVKEYKKVYFFLCEEDKRYKECFKIKIDEYERNPDSYSDKDKKEFFNWIEHIIEFTYNYDFINEQVYNNEKKGENEKLHLKFKKIILSYLKILCEISLDELSKITDNWFHKEEEQEDLILHLGGGVSNALQLKYIDHYFLIKKKDMNDNIEKYIKYLEIEIDLLIKERNKKRIQELLTEYKILCNEKILQKLLDSSINDCCIYIYQYLGQVLKGIELAVKEAEQKYENIINVIEKPNYNPILIDIELKEIYKYFELGLNVCQNNFFDQEKEDKAIDQSWLKLYNKACSFEMNFYPRYKINKNNIKTKDHKKIYTNLQNCIQLILDKMNDYITLDLLVDIIYAKCQQSNMREFYIFLDKSFYTFRRTETILQSGKNLMATSILIQYDNLEKINTEGKHIYMAETNCDFCKKNIKDLNTYTFKLFECGHKYHLNCCAEENEEKVCYVCTKLEIGDNEERAKNFKEGNAINEVSDEQKEKHEKEEKALEEKKKKSITKGRLNLLKKVRKKRREINSVISGRVVYGIN